jgi:DNA (cytosine-5)-methyltransferase 1
MRYLSVCSGIEAATVAWHPLGWQAVGFSEIESFPSAVLAHHYPSVPNFGDMTKFKEWNLERGTVNLLVGGTPCQSFSVAGLRKGLEDPRGNLALVYCGILDHLRPQWCVWENVPGVLSSSGGRDFGSFLGALAELGYGFAYRVLDAQYFGVAQRRRRVFVVGYLGDWRPAAEVLFEPESVRGHPAPSRKAGQEVAGTFTARARSGGWGQDPNLAAGGYMRPVQVAKCLTAGGNMRYDFETEDLIPSPIALADISSRDKNQNGAGWKDDGTMYTLDTTGLQGVAQPIGFTRCDYGNDAVVNGTPTMRCGSNYSAHLAAAIPSMAVRRLTPVECERLQGFPDNYTNIPWRKAIDSPDGPRYKALGNSMAVPVMKWIGERIELVKPTPAG